MTGHDIFTAVDRYICDLLAPEDEALAAAVKAMRAEGLPEISVSPALGKLLQLFARLVNARRILELGALGGYSAIWLARALPPGGRLITLEVDPRYAEVTRSNVDRAGLLDKVEIRVGRALDLLPVLAAENAGPFDLIFIDADKPPYPEYFEWALRLSRPGTLIVADNVIREGAVVDESKAADPAVAGVRRMAAALKDNPAVEACILQTVGVKGHDGMALAIVKNAAAQ